MEAHMELSDEDLLLQYCDGDAAAFATLYARQRTAVYSFLRLNAIGLDADALFDATWRRFVDLRQEPLGTGGVAARLFRIAQGLVADARAAGAPADWTEVERQEIAAAEDRLRDITERSRGRALQVRRSIGQLPVAQRESFLLYEAGGLPLPSVAAVEDEEVHIAAHRMQLALRALRAGLQRNSGDGK